MRVKDAFDVLEKDTPPVGIVLNRPQSTTLELLFPASMEVKTKVEVLVVPIVVGILGLYLAIVLESLGYALWVVPLSFIGSYYLIKRTVRELQDRLYTHFLLEVNSKGGQLYRRTEEGKTDLHAYFNWGELLSIAVKEVPKSEEHPSPHYIHLETKGSNVVRLFAGVLGDLEISYVASLLEALLDQRYRGAVPSNWKKELATLAEPVFIDWSEHLIDEE